MKLWYRIKFIFNHASELNRRVDIENTLLKMSNGSLPIPDQEECRRLALKLGTPKEYWPEGWK